MVAFLTMKEGLNAVAVLKLTVFFAVQLQFCYCFGQSNVEQADDGMSGKLSFGTPDLSDEEANSPFMPDQLKCDGCRIIAYKFYTIFDKFNKRRPSLKYKIPESEILDMTEEVCTDKYDDYGVKEVNKVKRLSGPGLETSEIPGVMQGGGKWPARLMAMCDDYLGDIGENEIYAAYTKKPESLPTLENFLCRGETNIQKACKKFDPRDEL